MHTRIFDHNFLSARHKLTRDNNASKLKILRFIEDIVLDNIRDIHQPIEISNILNLNANCTTISANLAHIMPNAKIITALPNFLSQQDDNLKHIIYDEHTIQHIHHAEIVICIDLLHLINNLQTFLKHVLSITKPSGVFMGNVLGPSTLTELRHTFMTMEQEFYQRQSPRTIPMIDAKNGALLMQSAGFKNVVSSTETFTITFDNWSKLISFLRMNGSNSLYMRDKQWLSKEFVKACENYYVSNFSNKNESIYSTIEVVFLTGFN